MRPGELAEECKSTSLFEWVAQDDYAPFEVARAEGSSFYRPDGRQVLDLASQLMVTNLGHSIEDVHAAVFTASRQVTYVSPLAASPYRAELGRKLAEVVPDHITRFFYATSGSEANNDAIRIARAVTGRTHVLHSSRSYHGSHGWAAMASGDPRRRYMETDPAPIVPFRAATGRLTDDVAAFRATVEAVDPERIAAVIIESVPGGSGVLVPPDGYLQTVEAICRDHGIQLICDEVLTGFGRTGRWFAFEHWGLRPDLMTMGKALSGGAAPISAVGVARHIADFLAANPLGCGHTFSAHPLCCAAASAALDLYAKTGAVERAARLGDVLAARLSELAAASRLVATTRSIGMLAAVELTEDAFAGITRVQHRMLDEGAYVLAKGRNLLIAPPLLIERSELERGLDIVARVLRG